VNAQKDTQRVALIGWPVEHSVSPAMFNAAFKALDMSWRYDALPVSADDLEATIKSLRAGQLRGINVTVPHKQAVIPLLDVIRPEAKAVGAVNTITVVGEDVPRLHGTNTDVLGFYKDLTRHLPSPRPHHSQALILGAGGAARAAAYVLATLGYQTFIACRTPAHGLELIRDVQIGLATSNTFIRGQIDSTQWRMQMRTLAWDRIGDIAPSATLIVNCTPVGMWPEVDQSPWPDGVPISPDAIVYDMVYRPRQTRLLQQALAAGAQAISGLGMLVQQGAEAFRIWTGQEAPLEVMYAAARSALTDE